MSALPPVSWGCLYFWKNLTSYVEADCLQRAPQGLQPHSWREAEWHERHGWCHLQADNDNSAPDHGLQFDGCHGHAEVWSAAGHHGSVDGLYSGGRHCDAYGLKCDGHHGEAHALVGSGLHDDDL